MSGSVTKSNAFDVGTPIWFRVVDNGEPPASDEITFVFLYDPGTEVTCHGDEPDAGLVPIAAGNVQVH